VQNGAVHLVVLYGPPGVGKLTVGTELGRLTGFRLFHNHLTVDLVTAVFAPQTAAWNRLAPRIRHDVFVEAAAEGVDLILTRAPRRADDAEVERVRAMTEPVRTAGGTVLFLRLACSRAEHSARLCTDERRSPREAHRPRRAGRRVRRRCASAVRAALLAGHHPPTTSGSGRSDRRAFRAGAGLAPVGRTTPRATDAEYASVARLA
jgi:hypothetical protein